MPVSATRKIRFGQFELDRQSGELFKLGHRLNLHGQPVEVLTILLERPGELVTREEFCKRLWPEDTFVDFEHSLNTAVKKLRQALDDDVEKPRYVETLPKKGYRFIGTVEPLASVAGAANSGDDPPSTSPFAALQEEAAKPKSRRRVWALVALAVLAVAGSAAYQLLRPRVPVVSAIHQLTRTGLRKNSYLATDGTRVYFNEVSAGKVRLAEVSTAGGEVSYLDSKLDSPFLADISADGSELLVANGTSPALYWTVPLPAGAPRRIPGEFTLAGFLPGSSQIVYLLPSEVLHMFASDIDGGNAHSLLQLPRNPATFDWAISPDGSKIRYVTEGGKVWESRIDGTQKHLLAQGFPRPPYGSNWTAGDKLFLMVSATESENSLWAISKPGWPGSREPRPVQLTFGSLFFGPPTASKDGKRIYALGQIPRGELSTVDVHTKTFRKYLGGISAGSTDFSRDGQWVTYVTDPQGRLWRSRLDGSERLQLTFPPMSRVINPKWSPDGRYIAFMDWNLHRKIYLVSADGGAPMLLEAGDFQPADPGWSSDGKFLVYGGEPRGMAVANPTDARSEIRILDLATKQSKTVPGSEGMYSPRWSPDGHYLAALSDDQKRLFLFSFEKQHWQEVPVPKLPEPATVGQPNWSHDGRYLYFNSAVGNDVYKLSVPGGKPALVVSLAGTDTGWPGMRPWGWDGWYGLTPDDQVLVMLDRSVDEVYALDVEYR